MGRHRSLFIVQRSLPITVLSINRHGIPFAGLLGKHLRQRDAFGLSGKFGDWRHVNQEVDRFCAFTDPVRDTIALQHVLERVRDTAVGAGAFDVVNAATFVESVCLRDVAPLDQSGKVTGDTFICTAYCHANSNIFNLKNHTT